MVGKSMFKGAIMFGAFPIPIQVSKATDNHDIAFHEYHASDMGRVGRNKPCKVCGAELTEADIIKGYEPSKGTVLTFAATDFETLPVGSSKNLIIDRYVSASEVSPLLYEEAYYVSPADD